MANKKQSMGRQRIEIKPIRKEEARQVCFSKRRNGLFKKASELSTLCGAEICAVVFSPAGKVFSFGHPSVDAVAHRFLAAAPSSHDPRVGAAAVRKLYEDYAQLNTLLEAEKRRRSALDEAMVAPELGANRPFWWNGEVDSMGAEALEAFHGRLAELRNAVSERVNWMLVPHGTMTAVQRPHLQLLQPPAAPGGRFRENLISLDVMSGVIKSEMYVPLPPSSIQPATSGRRVGYQHGF